MAKSEYVHIVIDDKYADDLIALKKANDDIKEYKSQADEISNEIKELGQKKWIELYENTSVNPGSLILECMKNGKKISIVYTPTDKYIKLNEKSLNYLRDTYGDDVIDTNVTHSITDKIWNKYHTLLEDFIKNNPDIDDMDKEIFFDEQVTNSVAHGLINDLNTFGDIHKIVEDVRPVIMLKDLKIVRE